ncbi:hypothetical protein BH24GEM3_BH24GEM3_05350 [soil metagenome]
MSRYPPLPGYENAFELVLVNRIRERVKAWREEGYPGVTRTTDELLRWWRRDGRDKRLFFAQLEVAETVIFLTEARADHLQGLDIPRDEPSVARTAEEATRAADEIGYPVVLKALSPRVIHKSDVGGVRVDLRDAAEVRAAFQQIWREVPERAGIPPQELEGVLVQAMARGGKETIIGMASDPAFGPLLMFGLGGVYVEALRDVVFRIHPVTEVDAREMVRSIRGVRLLEGIRGEPPTDLAAIEEVIQRISQLVADHELLHELDINPWMAYAGGGVAVDARIMLRSGRS